jgi:5-methyltetrahydrofolate--homocysteine methyltransferase
MDDQAIADQNSDPFDKGKFEACIQQLDTGSTSQVGIFELTGLSLEKKVPPPSVLGEAVDKAMGISIKEYIQGEFLLPELINRTKDIVTAREILSQCAEEWSHPAKGKAVLATINGDDHTHWRDVIGLFLKGLGVKVLDLGNNASVDQVVQSVKTENPDVLGITVHATSIIPSFDTAPSTASISVLQQVSDKLSQHACRDDVTMLVGGEVSGIISAEAVGADYCCENILQTIVVFDKLYNTSDTYSSISN